MFLSQEWISPFGTGASCSTSPLDLATSTSRAKNLQVVRLVAWAPTNLRIWAPLLHVEAGSTRVSALSTQDICSKPVPRSQQGASIQGLMGGLKALTRILYGLISSPAPAPTGSKVAAIASRKLLVHVPCGKTTGKQYEAPVFLSSLHNTHKNEWRGRGNKKGKPARSMEKVGKENQAFQSPQI